MSRSPSRSPSRRRRSSASSRALSLISVVVQPVKIELELVDEGVVKTEITVLNNGTEQILWKLQTTEPKKYSVSPTKGIINPGQSGVAEIQLLTLYCEQALADARSGSADVQRSTKFRLQVVRTAGEPLVAPEKPADLDVGLFDEKWTDIVNTGGKSAVFYEKLQCVFVFPPDVQLPDPDNAPAAISASSTPSNSRRSMDAVDSSDVRPLVSNNKSSQQENQACCVIS